jgi:hypothetical protein
MRVAELAKAYRATDAEVEVSTASVSTWPSKARRPA